MSKICFYEGENIGFGISFNADYNISRLTELELLVKAKNTEVEFRFKKSDGTLLIDSGNNHLFKALFSDTSTIGRAGEYQLQIRYVDTILGEKKTEIDDIHIHSSLVIQNNSVTINSNVIVHVFEISITNTMVQIAGRYDVNILGVSPKVLATVTNIQSGYLITHNMNTAAVRVGFYYENGEPEFNFLCKKGSTNANNVIECIFPTDDSYTGNVLIEQLF